MEVMTLEKEATFRFKEIKISALLIVSHFTKAFSIILSSRFNYFSYVFAPLFRHLLIFKKPVQNMSYFEWRAS